MITPAQCRASRALLGISQKQLAEAAGLSLRTLQGFEAGERALHSLALGAIDRILEAEGIILITETGWTGVKLRVQN